jgi:hypothetical protein
MQRPTGAKSNIPNGAPSNSVRIRETRMLGDVPIRVTSPPISDPKAMGISSLDTGVPLRRATWTAIGRKIARAPMFFMKEDRTVTLKVSTATCRPVLRINGSRSRITLPIRSDLLTAELRISTEAIRTTTGSPKPTKARSIDTTPRVTATRSPSSATKS